MSPRRPAPPEDPKFAAEIARFTERLIEDRLVPSSAATEARTLAAMVRRTRSPNVEAFFAEAARLPPAITAPPGRGRTESTVETLQARHRAIQDFLHLCADMLPAGTEHRCMQAIDRAFPGRITPVPHLVDRVLGGSTKEVRRRVSLTWADGDRITNAPISRERAEPERLRDRALATIHLRSGLTPQDIRRLRWEDVVALLGQDAEIVTVHLKRNGIAFHSVMHADAIASLRALWAAMEQPRSGPVFTSMHRPHPRLSGDRIADLLAEHELAAGFPRLDRRHLRAPFAWWLLNVRQRHEDWVRDVFGLAEVRYLRNLVDGQKSAAAQVRSTEFLVLTDVIDNRVEVLDRLPRERADTSGLLAARDSSPQHGLRGAPQLPPKRTTVASPTRRFE